MVCGKGGLPGLRIGGRTFGGLGLQGHPDGSLERNIFEDSCAEEGTGSGNDIFEGGFKFAASEARRKFNSTASEVHREEYRYAYTSNQDNQILVGKMKHRVNRSMI